ncbi:MAG TPA: hypothetical protein VF223_15030 [Trebonia sp.]
MAAGRVPGPGLGRDGGEPVGEDPAFGTLGVEGLLGAIRAGGGGSGEFAGGLLQGLAGGLNRADLPFGLLAGGGQVHSGALRAADGGVALADGGITGGGLRGHAFCGFGVGLGGGECGGGSFQCALKLSDAFFCGAGAFLGLSAGGVGRVGCFPRGRGGLG